MTNTVKKRVGNVTIEDARIIFRNFSGKEGTYNAAGNRNFNVLLEPDLAEAMAADGWNVKYLRPREEGDEPQARVEVTVSYRLKPPRVGLITSRGRTLLGEEHLEILDYADIEKVDVILNPSFWEVNGKSGIKAYLQTIFVTIREDELERKYADVPEIGFGGAPAQIEAATPLMLEAATGTNTDDIVDAELLPWD